MPRSAKRRRRRQLIGKSDTGMRGSNTVSKGPARARHGHSLRHSRGPRKVPAREQPANASRVAKVSEERFSVGLLNEAIRRYDCRFLDESAPSVSSSRWADTSARSRVDRTSGSVAGAWGAIGDDGARRTLRCFAPGTLKVSR